MAAHVKSFLKGVMLCLSPRFHEGGGFRDDKDSRVVGLLVGGENEKALAVGRIAVGHAVHDFSVEEIHPYFQTGVIEFEVLHGELFVRFVILVAAEVFHEEDGLDEGGEHRDDVLVIFESCDVEAVFGGGEIECAALDNLSVPKMNYHPICSIIQAPSRLKSLRFRLFSLYIRLGARMPLMEKPLLGKKASG